MLMRSLIRLRNFFSEPFLPAVEAVQQTRRLVSMMRLEELARAERYANPRCLVRSGYQCSSQNDEDGIVDEIFRRIGTTNREFIEFGVEGGTENNTLHLLIGGWRGLWIEASSDSAATIRRDFAEPLQTGQLRLIEAMVTAESIEGQFEEGRVSNEPDLLSIDIDGNDYWIWKAIVRVRPRVLIIEYNASLGRTARLVQPYDPSWQWDQTMGFGASLAALEGLGQEKGYALVGCNLSGVNAFFVRKDCLGDHFLEPFTAANHYQPPRFGTARAGHPVRWKHFDSV